MLPPCQPWGEFAGMLQVSSQLSCHTALAATCVSLLPSQHIVCLCDPNSGRSWILLRCDSVLLLLRTGEWFPEGSVVWTEPHSCHARRYPLPEITACLCFSSGMVRIASSLRTLVRPRYSTAVPSFSSSPACTSQCRGSSCSKRCARASEGPAARMSSTWCSSTMPVLVHRKMHGSF